MAQFQLAVRQRLPVRFAEHRYDNFALEIRVIAREIDIEHGGVDACAAVFEHVQPHAVFGADRHMIRHDIDDEAQPRIPQGGDQRPQPVLPAEFRVDPGRIGDPSVGHRDVQIDPDQDPLPGHVELVQGFEYRHFPGAPRWRRTG